MKILPVTGLLGLVAVGVGGWYRFHHLTPKTLRQYLEWQGLRLISDSESNYWKAVISENENLLKEMNIDLSTIEGVKSWCNNNLDSENYKDLKSKASLLCVDKPRTIKARIIQLDGGIGKLIQKSKQYKVAYIFRKHISGFNDLIGYQPKVDGEGKEIIDLEVATFAFRKWCVKSLGEPVDETLTLNIRELCTPKSFSKVREYLKGRILLTDENQDIELEKVHNRIKDFASYKFDILGQGKDKLKNWCETNLEKDFDDGIEVFDEILPKVISRCVKDVKVIDS